MEERIDFVDGWRRGNSGSVKRRWKCVIVDDWLLYNRRFVNVVVGFGKKRGPNSNPT